MIRQNIILGDYVFVADLYKAHVDIKDENIYKSEWVMLRHFDVMNTIAYDTDIYFIERSVIEEALKDINKKNSITDDIVFPTLENKYTGYSSNYKDFNDDYNYYTFRLRKKYSLLDSEKFINSGFGLFKLEEQDENDDVYIELDKLSETNTDIYNLVNEENELQQIECDTVRIYHPICIKKLDTIIYMDNYINNIHFHYYCQKYENLETSSETEFEDYHNRYSEFVEFHIPNIEYLFGEGNVYFNEDLNLVTKEIKDNPPTGTIWDNKLWETYNTEIVSDKYDNYFFKIKTETGTKTAQFTFKYNDLKLLDEPNEYGQYGATILNGASNDEYALYYNADTNLVTLVINENCNLTWIKNVANRIPANYNYVSYVYWDADKEGDSDVYYQKQLLTNATDYLDDKQNYLSSIIPLNTLLLPFTIDKDRNVDSETYGYYIKHYIEEKRNIWTNYISWPINLTLYPYEYLDEKSNLYILDSYINGNSDTFQSGCKFELCAKMGFAGGVISLINEFKYPDTFHQFEGIKDAYKFYNNVTENDYSSMNPFFDGDDNKDEDEKYESSSNVKYCGYKIEIASDIRFTNIIYESEESMEFIDDFAFQLNGLFNVWEEMPEVLVIRSKFIDKYLCNTIFSNFVVVTKEWFKYLINNEYVYRLPIADKQEHVDTEGRHRYLYWDGRINDENDKIKHTNGPSNVIWNKIYKSLLNTTEDMNTDYFNYIDKINCVIKTKEKDYDIKLNAQNTQQILYRPIFYKVADGQNIKIRESLTQNIGINLGAYMNKVNTFYLFIDGMKYEEYGRNDIFVLFRINAIDISGNNGKYDITNEDGDYITTGNWTIY